MKSEHIVISGSEAGMEDALRLAESFGGSQHGPQLRQLAELLLTTAHAVTGGTPYGFWLEEAAGTAELHLTTRARMTAADRAQLLSAASSGKNSAATGLLGLLQEFFARMMASYERAGVPEYYASGLILYDDTAPTEAIAYGTNAPSASWSLQKYISAGRKPESEEDPAAAAARDALKTSALAQAADEVRVGIRGEEVEIVVYQKWQ